MVPPGLGPAGAPEELSCVPWNRPAMDWRGWIFTCQLVPPRLRITPGVVIPSPSVRPTLAYRRLLLTHRCKRAQGLRREAACVPRRHPLCCQVDSRWTDWRVSASPPHPPLPSPVNPTLASSYLMNPFTAAQSGPYLFVFLASVKHILCFCSASNLQDNLSQIL